MLVSADITAHRVSPVCVWVVTATVVGEQLGHVAQAHFFLLQPIALHVFHRIVHRFFLPINNGKLQKKVVRFRL